MRKREDWLAASPGESGIGTPATRLHRVGAAASRLGSLRPADPRLRWGLYAGIALVVGLSVGLTAAATLGDFPDLELRFRPAWLGAGAFGFILLTLIQGQVWRRLLHALGPEISSRRAAAIWCVSALGKYVPTSLLIPMIRVAMAERVGVPKRICLASVIYEVALAFTATLAVSAYFLIELPELGDRPERFAVIALPALALLLLQPRIFHPLANGFFELLGRERLPLALSPGDVLKFVLVYGLVFLYAGACVFALAQSVEPLEAGDLGTVMGAFAVGTTVGILSFFLPAGLVAREAGVALALSPVMGTAPAIAVAVLARIAQIAAEALLALVTPLFARGQA
jgi:hypothetical protein